MRRKETWEVCHAIHGGSDANNNPTVIGMFDALVVKQKVDESVNMAMQVPSLRKRLTKELVYNERKLFYKSKENKLRSLNVYYSHNVMGKRKYIALRKAN